MIVAIAIVVGVMVYAAIAGAIFQLGLRRWDFAKADNAGSPLPWLSSFGWPVSVPVFAVYYICVLSWNAWRVPGWVARRVRSRFAKPEAGPKPTVEGEYRSRPCEECGRCAP